ncbi:MAG: hypothetical protein ACE5J9_00805 [Methanosarcinales archaeon]
MEEEARYKIYDLTNEIIVFFLSQKYDDAFDKYQKLAQMVFSELLKINTSTKDDEDW